MHGLEMRTSFCLEHCSNAAMKIKLHFLINYTQIHARQVTAVLCADVIQRRNSIAKQNRTKTKQTKNGSNTKFYRPHDFKTNLTLSILFLFLLNLNVRISHGSNRTQNSHSKSTMMQMSRTKQE